MTSDYESKGPGVHLQQGYVHTCSGMWIRFGSLHSVCPGDIGYKYRRCFGKESCYFILEPPMSSSAMDINMVSLLIPSIINGFLIGLNVYLMNVLHAVWIYFHTLQEHLDQVDNAFRWRQSAIIFCFQILHITNKTHGFKKLSLACVWWLWSWEHAPCVQELETLKSEVHSRLLELRFQACWKWPKIIWWIVMMWDLLANNFS